MRKTICRSNRLAVLVVGAALAPATASAQADTAAARPVAAAAGDTAALHVVRRGDTLWDLAIQYLRDPFGWPSIYRENRDVVENPHRIYPGERLRIPGGVAPADAVASGGTSVPTAPARVGGIAVTPAGADTADGVSFVVTLDSRLGDATALAARRLADYLAAPYVAPVGGPATLGRVEATERGLASATVGPRTLVLGDEVRLVLAPGAVPTPGAKLVVAALGDRVGDGQVVRPTGIVEIEEFEGAVARARVIVVLDHLREGQGLYALPPAPSEPAPSPTGVTVRVTWVENGSTLPGPQDWLVLSALPGSGVSEGAEVEFVRSVKDSARPGLLEVLGRARIVRVTPFGASAYITNVEQAGIGVGVAGRVASN